MIISPLSRYTPRPVALLHPEFRRVRITTVEGTRVVKGAQRVHEALRRLEGHRVYVPYGLRRLIHTTGATCWTAKVWRGRAVSMSLDGTDLVVTSLRRSLPSGPVDPLDQDKLPSYQFSCLLEVLYWLSDLGVSPGSLSSMAWNTWRASLVKPIEVGFNHKVSKEALYGGRKSATPHSYSDQVALDIKSAYPSVMVERPFALSLREVDPATRLDPLRAGLAKVRVTVPDDLTFAPLPVRVAPEIIQWRTGVVEGVYPWGEIAAAQSLGCEVEVLRCWAPLEEADLFSPWWATMLKGRSTLGGGSVKILKSLSNLVWSGFALNGDDSAVVRWCDEWGEETMQVAGVPLHLPQGSSVHVAAEVSSRVRVKMLLEGLYGDVEEPAHVDTDGIIVSQVSAARRHQGDAVGEWRPKQLMSVCEVKAPQLYRYECGPLCGASPKVAGSHSRWHYVASGTPASEAPELFESHPGFQVSMNGLDTVIPSRARLDDTQLRRWIEAQSAVETSAYGPRLA